MKLLAAVLGLGIIFCCADCGKDEEKSVDPKPPVSDATPNGEYNVTMLRETNSCGTLSETSSSFTTTVTVSGSSITFRGGTGNFSNGHAVITWVSECIDEGGGCVKCREMIYDLTFARFQGSGDYIGFQGSARFRRSWTWQCSPNGAYFCEANYSLVGTKK